MQAFDASALALRGEDTLINFHPGNYSDAAVAAAATRMQRGTRAHAAAAAADSPARHEPSAAYSMVRGSFQQLFCIFVACAS